LWRRRIRLLAFGGIGLPAAFGAYFAGLRFALGGCRWLGSARSEYGGARARPKSSSVSPLADLFEDACQILLRTYGFCFCGNGLLFSSPALYAIHSCNLLVAVYALAVGYPANRSTHRSASGFVVTDLFCESPLPGLNP
jgi:hypothetical protein